MTLEVSEETKKLIDREASSERYPSADEAVSTALLSMQKQRLLELEART